MDNTEFSKHSSSFRDPAGFIFKHSGRLYRQINRAGKDDYNHFIKSGLYDELRKKNLIVVHQEVSNLKQFQTDPKRYKVIQPELIPFISYPYEWTFSQLKAAALLTLDLQKRALARGMILKDSSAYNIQFIGQHPIFIDTLSFKIYETGSPWDGYKQFCEHFIAPLALVTYNSPQMLRSLQVWLDGIPLALATRLLPFRARWRPRLLTHLYLHAGSQKRYQPASKKLSAKARPMGPLAMTGLMASLERTIADLRLTNKSTEWQDYYRETNYSAEAFAAKRKIVRTLLKKVTPAPKTVWDMGANDGTFSELAAEIGAYTVAFDGDYQAVERNYTSLRPTDRQKLILPLIQDLANPSPPLGWAHAERSSLMQRGPADVVLALALIHHLAIGNNLPFFDIAAFFKAVSRYLIIEFVPREDSNTQLLLAGRNNIFDEYDAGHFEEAFAKYFTLTTKEEVPDSQRVIYLYKAKA